MWKDVQKQIYQTEDRYRQTDRQTDGQVSDTVTIISHCNELVESVY